MNGHENLMRTPKGRGLTRFSSLPKSCSALKRGASTFESEENMQKIINQNDFLLLLLSEEQYMSRLYKIIKSIKGRDNKICYVCLNKPCDDIIADFKENGIDTGSFFFIDVLSSHYGTPKPRKNCVFLDSPGNLEAIKKAIETTLNKENCGILLFDTISTLLIYQEKFPILTFTHSLKAEKRKDNIKKVYIVLKKGDAPEKESTDLINDLEMFADRTVDMD